MRSVYHNAYINQNDQFHINDIDDAEATAYYGYSAEDGSWYIMQNVVANKTYRYAHGMGDYATAWTGRASLSYDYYHNIQWHSGHT